MKDLPPRVTLPRIVACVGAGRRRRLVTSLDGVASLAFCDTAADVTKAPADPNHPVLIILDAVAPCGTAASTAAFWLGRQPVAPPIVLYATNAEIIGGAL